MDIYWIKEQKRCGPATVPDVVSMVQSGELTPETRGWHVGCEGWMPLRDLPALIDFLNPREPEGETASEPVSTSDEATPGSDREEALPPVPVAEPDSEQHPDTFTLRVNVYNPGAGVRLLARLVDMSLYSTLVYAMIYMLNVGYSPYLLLSSPLFWLGMIALETISLRLFGTTPGKKLLNIYVWELSQEGFFGLSPMKAFFRSFMVFIGGLGMMMYMLPLIMGIISWFTLNRRGATSWDLRGNTRPVQFSRPGAPRFVMAALVLFCSLHCCSFFLQPWLPAWLDDLARQAPSQAATLRAMLHETMPPSSAAPESAPVAPETEFGSRFLEL